MPVRTALLGMPGQSTHGWQNTGDTQIIGVVNVTDYGNPDAIATALEAQGVIIIEDVTPTPGNSGAAGSPPVQGAGASLSASTPATPAVPAAAVTALGKFGVTATDTKKTAMAKIVAASGFPPLNPRRF